MEHMLLFVSFNLRHCWHCSDVQVSSPKACSWNNACLWCNAVLKGLEVFVWNTEENVKGTKQECLGNKILLGSWSLICN